MHGVRVVLIGGTSHTGKSSVARVVADRLGFEYRSTDGLARHPGRPWPTPEWAVPPHVAEHYRTLGTAELIASVLAHYERLWPRIEQLVRAYATGDGGSGLVLEGSALWPDRVAALDVPHTAAVWLTAPPQVLWSRIREGGGYPAADADARQLVDAFAARAERFQQLVADAVDALGLTRLDGDGLSVEEAADAVAAAVEAAPDPQPAQE